MLSEKQHNILDFINQFITDEGYAPTIREIQRGCEISSTSVVSYNINALKEKGYFDLRKNSSRGIVNNKFHEKQIRNIPVVAKIAAGQPLEISEDIQTRNFDENIEIPVNWFPDWGSSITENIIALKVKGDSMIGDMIRDGDVILVEKTEHLSEIQPNQISVISIKDENACTLKRIRLGKNKDEVTLISSNPSYKAITKKASDIKVEGKVLALLRSYKTDIVNFST